jgi:hypothetical protein
MEIEKELQLDTNGIFFHINLKSKTASLVYGSFQKLKEISNGKIRLV